MCQAAADALDVGDTVTDSFNYTVTDGGCDRHSSYRNKSFWC